MGEQGGINNNDNARGPKSSNSRKTSRMYIGYYRYLDLRASSCSLPNGKLMLRRAHVRRKSIIHRPKNQSARIVHRYVEGSVGV
jgi:hypothetical protein